jgi:cyclic pyranopterin phosphate synthase
MMRLEELFEVVRLMASRLGFNKVRVTGGEPLIRRGAVPFMKSLGLIDAIDDLSFTTNAHNLEPVADELRAAGYGRVNISLDTLRRDRFRDITGVDGLDRVLAGIAAARRAGFDPIKLNVVSLERHLDEFLELIEFALANDLQIRFIELMPVGKLNELRFVPNARVKEIIERRYQLLPVAADTDVHSAARLYRIAGTSGTCGFISSMTEPFCSMCNRIRLRGDGRLRPCLARTESYDLMEFVRPQFRPEDLEAYLREIIRAKRPAGGAYEIDTMSAFGG